MLKKTGLLLFLWALMLPPIFGQTNTDSLWTVWEDSSQPDSTRVLALHNYIWYRYLFSQPDSAFYFAQKELEFAQKTGNKNFEAKALNTQGISFSFRGDHSRAIDYYSRSLAISEAINDLRSSSNAVNNIGVIYMNQGNYEKAREYFQKSLDIDEVIGNQEGIANSLNNIGSVCQQHDKVEEALLYFEKALDIHRKLNNPRGIATSLTNLANSYIRLGELNVAMDFFEQCLKIDRETNDHTGIAGTLQSIGDLHKDQGNYAEAIRKGHEALQVAQDAGLVEEVKFAAALLYTCYKKVDRPDPALDMYELYVEMRDSIESEENQRAVINQEYKYQYEKQAAADSIRAAEAQKVSDALITAQKAQLKQEQTQRYGLFGGVGLLLVFGAFMYNRFRVTRQQKIVIGTQKDLVEKQKATVVRAHAELAEKNQEITDSIQYAKRIQSAIMPPLRLVQKHLPNSFILYKPKDIVAGDFYWMEARGDTVYFAAADCTGHGVPGAMVSVVCVNGLNRSVRESGLSDPGKILDNTRELVIKEFGKSDEEVKDGMDISLCALNLKTGQLKWAGANNPLWIVRSGNEAIEEIKANKQPIGKYALETPFDTHNIQLNSGDSIYLFSDGYPDQFGGELGKKYKSGKFKRTIVEVSQLPIDQQKETLNTEFESWRGTLEQIDDVCVIGVRI